jgi:hypothetical protein
MATLLSQEFLLAAACTVWPPCDRRSEAIRKLTAGPLDWDRFQRVVARHRVAGLVHDGLTRAQPAVPPDIADKIRRQAAALLRRNLAYAAESVRLQNLFAAAELPVVFLKGVSLAVLAYGDLCLRHSLDIDLFVHLKSIATAEILLGRAGYRRTDPPAAFSEAQVQTWLLRCKDMAYVHAEKRFKVELHARLFNNPRLMAEMPVTSSLRMVPLVNGIGLRTFGEDDLSPICAHTARSTAGFVSSGSPTSLPSWRVSPRAALSGFIGRPTREVRVDVRRRPCFSANGFWGRQYRAN